jgi:hypothetical protein
MERTRRVPCEYVRCPHQGPRQRLPRGVQLPLRWPPQPRSRTGRFAQPTRRRGRALLSRRGRRPRHAATASLDRGAKRRGRAGRRGSRGRQRRSRSDRRLPARRAHGCGQVPRPWHRTGLPQGTLAFVWSEDHPCSWPRRERPGRHRLPARPRRHRSRGHGRHRQSQTELTAGHPARGSLARARISADGPRSRCENPSVKARGSCRSGDRAQ